MRYGFLFEYRPRYEFEGNANFVASLPEEPVHAKLSSLSAMLATFVDLDLSRSANSAFVGLGIGMARNKVGTTTDAFRNTSAIVPGNSSSDLAWMVTAGFGVGWMKGPYSKSHGATRISAGFEQEPETDGLSD